MRNKAGLPPVAFVLLGLLAISAFLISLGQRELTAKPSVESFAPSGASAFSQVLAKQGYMVAGDRHPRPKLGKEDILIAYRLKGLRSFDDSEIEDPFREFLLRHVQGGGRAILLPISTEFLDASREIRNNGTTEVDDLGSDRTYKVTAGWAIEDGASGSETDSDHLTVALWVADDEDFLRAFRIGEGTALSVRDGIFTTNRFIDQADNARAAVDLVSLLGPPGSRVVFAEASIGNVSEPGLLETLGAWADAAWQQTLFLFVVIVYTLGKRFGFPESERRKQRGTRDLLDAIGDTLHRGRHRKLALDTSLTACDQRIRASLLLPRDTDRRERDDHLPTSLRQALVNVEVAAKEEDLSSARATKLVRTLISETDRFIASQRTNPAARQ